MYVLILMVTFSGSYGRPYKSIAMHEFSSKKYCEEAAKIAANQFGNATFVCVPK